ncbi:RNA transcription, translation and transport factor protein-like [Montipora foliosa]|uniref:RNA transcription, translation and transport factor protein-like n=1 Tax=Montipora foliosa TaxID=591990 RepID=UPI0035F19F5B
MYRRKLKALGHHNPEGFDVHNEEEVRNLVVWLEDQKIRLYKIEEREQLRDIKNSGWLKALRKYLDDLTCPVNISQKLSVLDWLLAHAVRLEYAENVEKYNSTGQKDEKQQGGDKSSLDDSLINLSVDNPDLKAGVTSLSKLLNLPHHPDHFVLLQAVRSLIEGKLSQESPKSGKKSGKKVDIIPLNQVKLGFDSGDSAINEAAKIIRLLHLTELRELQTRINEAIVAVQAITANPKTDQSLGRVGV